jgi:hypothetical protein
MLHALAVVVLGASAGPWGELQFEGAGTYASGLSLSSWGGMGTVAVDAYLHHRLVEDDAPLSLQPFLQRTGSIEGSFSGSGFSTDRPGFVEPFHGTSFGGSFAIDGYTGEVLALYGSASFFRATTGGGFAGAPGAEYLLPSVTVAPGLRFGDTRINVGYTWAPTIHDGTYDGRGFGEVYLRINSVIARRVLLSLLGEVILSGGLGSVALAVFPSRMIGISAAVEFAQGAIFYDSRNVYARWQPSAAVSWWITSRVSLGLEYRFIHTEPVDSPGVPYDTHRIGLTLAARLD